MKKRWILEIGAVAVIAVGVWGVQLASNSSTIQVSGTSFNAVLVGAEEVPSVTTASTGEATFVLSADGMTLNFILTVNNMTNISASHIHLAMPGVTGPVVVPLFAGPKPGAFSGILAQGTITSAELKGLLAGKPLSALITEINNGNSYVNVHTTANPGGEIRGQIRMAP